MACKSPHILIMQWRPSQLWLTLNTTQQLFYLRTLDERIEFGQSLGMEVLGWSKVDDQISKSPGELWVGVFGFQTKHQINNMLLDVAQSKWYEYFETTNVAIELLTAGAPHLIYADLLGIPSSC
jgi:hypothetical protein